MRRSECAWRHVWANNMQHRECMYGSATAEREWHSQRACVWHSHCNQCTDGHDSAYRVCMLPPYSLATSTPHSLLVSFPCFYLFLYPRCCQSTCRVVATYPLPHSLRPIVALMAARSNDHATAQQARLLVRWGHVIVNIANSVSVFTVGVSDSRTVL